MGRRRGCWDCRLHHGQRKDPDLDPCALEGVLKGSLALAVCLGCLFKMPIPGPVPHLPNQNLRVPGSRMDISNNPHVDPGAKENEPQSVGKKYI